MSLCNSNGLKLNFLKFWVKINIYMQLSSIKSRMSFWTELTNTKILVSFLTIISLLMVIYLNMLNTTYISYLYIDFVYRNSKEFTKMQTLLTLYVNSIVPSRLEHTSLIRFRIYNIYIIRVECVQMKFLSVNRTDGFYTPRSCQHELLLDRL